MLDKLKQLMEVKRQADQLKKELESVTFEMNDVRGIKMTMNGTQKVLSVDVDSQYLALDGKKKLEADLVRSFNNALQRSRGIAAEKMKHLTGFDFPGM